MSGMYLDKFADEVERKLRSGSTNHIVFPTLAELHHVKTPKVHKTIHCPNCGMPLWVAKHPRAYKCPNCRVLSFPCEGDDKRCKDKECNKSVCKHWDGEYYEEATGIVEGK